MDTDPESSTSGERSTADGRYRALVEIVNGLLDAAVCELLVEEDGRLVVEEDTARDDDQTGSTYSLATSLPGMAYTAGRSCVIADQYDTRSVASSGSAAAMTPTPFPSLCCVPVGNQRLLLAKARGRGAFTDEDLEKASQVVELARSEPASNEMRAVPATDGGAGDDRNRAELLEVVADVLSHDFKNHLNVVSGNLELALEADDADAFIARASNGLTRLESLVEEVVSLAKTGDIVREMERVELHDRAEAVWASVETGGATLELERGVEFLASPRSVDHILENLMGNAVAHAGPEVTVKVGGLTDGFYLEDDGPGIPPDSRERVFERGYTTDEASTGLGLPIVKRIVDAQGWTIDVVESSEGGARFEITGVEDVEA